MIMAFALSAGDMAVYNITIKIMLMLMMFASSFATALTVRMNYFLGNGDHVKAKKFTFAGI